ncbi:MAG: tRNA (N(6)-L-threonylcarbamoyladenosine(37)-C(2))-methylthiotransferase MtaB [Saprospiraceae bacterium]
MATPRTVAFHTLGCKLNFSETSSIKRSFEDHGYAAVDFEAGADIYVLNTCSVTDFADKKCRYEVRRALKYAPDAKIVVVGCYAQLKPEEISQIPGVDLVLGAAEKFNILQYIDGISASSDKGMVIAGEVKDANSFVDAFSFGDRTRSFLKVQDGCDYKCTFCTIPQARGASRSDTIPNVVSNAVKIADLGAKEIVLTGVNLGDFGNGTEVIEGIKPQKDDLFIDLIKSLDQVDGIERYRISSIEPNLLTDEIINFVAQSNRFVPHFHIPLQSSNDRILKAMRRRYLREHYQKRVAYIRQAMPHCCIGVDVIVGFPGETDAEFDDTCQFLIDLDISYLHVFTYSERANTPANEMSSPVPMEIRRKRNEILRAISSKKRMAFAQPYLGTTRSVLLEQSKDKDTMSGFTDNYIKVSLPLRSELINQVVPVQLISYDIADELVHAKLISV